MDITNSFSGTVCNFIYSKENACMENLDRKVFYNIFCFVPITAKGFGADYQQGTPDDLDLF